MRPDPAQTPAEPVSPKEPVDSKFATEMAEGDAWGLGGVSGAGSNESCVGGSRLRFHRI